MDLRDFWSGLRGVLSTILPTHSVSAYFNYFQIGRGFHALHQQTAPGTHQPWDERRQFSPTPSYLRAHVGQRIFGLREMVPDTRVLRNTDYFKKVMAVEGWQSLLCLTFWKQNNPLAMVVLRKTPEQGEFQPRELAQLGSLYDHVEAALDRLQQMHDQQATLACLARSLPGGPHGLLVLNGALTPLFKNGTTGPTRIGSTMQQRPSPYQHRLQRPRVSSPSGR